MATLNITISKEDLSTCKDIIYFLANTAINSAESIEDKYKISAAVKFVYDKFKLKDSE